MIKKTAGIFFCFLLILSLCGCWNYRGLNEITIVSGVAIDKNQENGNYHLSIEIIDLSTPIKNKGVSAKLIESEGETLFDAFRNAKKRIMTKLYIGSMQTIVISEEIARNEDISDIIDLFLRDAESRETMHVVISQEKTAKKILSIQGIGNTIISFEIQKIIENDQKIIASTVDIQLYNIFNVLHAQGTSLALPAFHNIINDGEPVSESNGIAIFRDERMVGYLPAGDSKYYLFATNQVNGGLLVFSSAGETQGDTSLEISKSKTERSYSYENGKIKILLKTHTDVFLAETKRNINAIEEDQIATLERTAQTILERKITQIIKKVQTEYGTDIFGFGNMIYKKDPRLWKQLSENWDNQFKTLEVEVQSEIHIMNSALIMKP